ncbi:hypothetical protein [Waddlia chondrophila]|uniref:Secreted protein n=2 Tax=Waddlia chondrophila TaxID=71667 RepID=D6YTM7_WADCW|nr:hypothetical protein [Waddlia chondrophila]ADI37488.1 hypothetical protein wcw_0113 [Waddlia chondrophila WSU 86-1044]
MIRMTFLISLFLAASLMASADEKEVKYEEDIIIQEPECLQLMTVGRGSGSDYVIKFYNSCPKRIWASICVEERPGKFKLHESSTRIPKYGYMDIYTYEGTAPVSVNWISGSSRPFRPPGQCGTDVEK